MSIEEDYYRSLQNKDDLEVHKELKEELSLERDALYSKFLEVFTEALEGKDQEKKDPLEPEYNTKAIGVAQGESSGWISSSSEIEWLATDNLKDCKCVALIATKPGSTERLSLITHIDIATDVEKSLSQALSQLPDGYKADAYVLGNMEYTNHPPLDISIAESLNKFQEKGLVTNIYANLNDVCQVAISSTGPLRIKAKNREESRGTDGLIEDREIGSVYFGENGGMGYGRAEVYFGFMNNPTSANKTILTNPFNEGDFKPEKHTGATLEERKFYQEIHDRLKKSSKDTISGQEIDASVALSNIAEILKGSGIAFSDQAAIVEIQKNLAPIQKVIGEVNIPSM